MKVWFDQADANHDGKLTPAELLADHRLFFARLDSNHDGVIDGLEVADYEAKIAPEILAANDRASAAPPPVRAEPDDTPGGIIRRSEPGGGQAGGRGGGRGGQGGPGGGAPSGGGSEGGGLFGRGGNYQGAARYGLLSEPEPIRSADIDTDFRVSLAEWDAASARRFSALDSAHHGYLAFTDMHRLQPEARGAAGGQRGPGGR